MSSSSSSNSSTVASGMIILQNPDPISPRVTSFHGVIWVGAEGLEQVGAYLRHFRSEFEEAAEYPKAAKMELAYTVVDPDPQERAKYHLIGDLKKFGIPNSLDAEDPNATWATNPCQRMWFHVCCTVTSDDQKKATFTGTPEQYTSIVADAKRLAEEEDEPPPFLKILPVRLYCITM
ncbi:hypothetical protein B0H13DRAFT_2300025 [Mycena leptocephala]|nr:hypothetical protein B0H13DRAFT_2300025 [Mycena leptocephala]